MTFEYRTASAVPSADGDTVTGLVTPFSTETVIGDLKRGGFREQIAPGAFKKTLQERDIVFLWNHNADMPLARTSAGNLSLREADDGLHADATPVDTSYGADLVKLTRAGVVKGMSFGFEVVKDDWTDDDGRASNPQIGTHRTVHEVRLHEVSAVTFPAYESTKFGVRDAVNAARRIEERDNPKPYGDVEYADPKNGKYPVDTEAHAKAAWSYINMPKNADQYPLNGVTLASVKAKIVAALKKFGVQVSEENAEDVAPEVRADAEPANATPEHMQCLASIDAAIDEAVAQFQKCDRDSLPPEANQGIDLLHAAWVLVGKAMDANGIPDPDSPNGNSYDGAGSATPDEDERADMALLAQSTRFKGDI